MKLIIRCLIFAVLLTCPALAFPPDALARVRQLLPESQPTLLPAAKWTIADPHEGRDGATSQPTPATRQIDVAAAINWNGNAILEERATGKIFFGVINGPNSALPKFSYNNFDAFLVAMNYAPLPKPPEGFALRQVATFPVTPVRITSDGTGKSILVLTLDGSVYQIDLPSAQPKKILVITDYAKSGSSATLGITYDNTGRLYIVSNVFDMNANPALNHVTIYRGTLPKLEPWFQIDIPFAIDVFQHSVTYIAQGPDGMMYVSSGSRTDHGEKGDKPNLSKEGETPTTSAIWRLNPKENHPKLEIFAKGLRNAFGFCFDDIGHLWATENGPNADPPEELNLVQKGKHYGFPYQFSDWDHKAYADQPDPPPGLEFEPPITTFDPHSSPSGIVALGSEFPEPYRNTLLVALGNLLGTHDVGFDLVQVIPETLNGKIIQATVHPFLSPIARPTDLHYAGHGKIYICEFWRQIHNDGNDLPGRILELSTTDTGK